MAGDRCLIVNADDFGLSEGTNRGIIKSHERGIVTSTSLMVRQPAAASAAAYGKANPALAIGLHLDLGEWEWRDGAWFQVYQVIATEDADAVSAEIGRQMDLFHDLLGRAPTHLDSHQHVHQHEPVRALAGALARRLCIPLRAVSGNIAFCGHFYGHGRKSSPFPDGISTANLLSLLRKLPAGTTELSCHPGLDESLASCYRLERVAEVLALCDRHVLAAVESEGIRLISFGDSQ